MPQEILFSLNDLLDSPLASPQIATNRNSIVSQISGFIPIYLEKPNAFRKSIKNATSKLFRSSTTSINSSSSSSYSNEQVSPAESISSTISSSHNALSPRSRSQSPQRPLDNSPPIIKPYTQYLKQVDKLDQLERRRKAPRSAAGHNCCLCEEPMSCLLDGERPLLLECDHFAHYECLYQLFDNSKYHPRQKNKPLGYPECPNCGEIARPASRMLSDELINDRLVNCPYANKIDKLRPSKKGGFNKRTAHLSSIAESPTSTKSMTPRTPNTLYSYSKYSASPQSFRSDSTLYT